MNARLARPVLVLTALDLEYQAVSAHLTGLRRHPHPAGTLFETGYLPGAEGEVARDAPGGPAFGVWPVSPGIPAAP
jgi:hypothetical protein